MKEIDLVFLYERSKILDVTKKGEFMETKPVYLSKTLWVNLILAGTAFFGPAAEYLRSHPDVLTMLFTGVNIVLRFLTKGKVVLW